METRPTGCLATCIILAKVNTDVTWKIGGLEIYKYADGHTGAKTSSTALFLPSTIHPKEAVRAAGVPKFRVGGGLECHVERCRHDQQPCAI